MIIFLCFPLPPSTLSSALLCPLPGAPKGGAPSPTQSTVPSPAPSFRFCCICLISTQTSGSQASPLWPPKSHPADPFTALSDTDRDVHVGSDGSWIKVCLPWWTMSPGGKRWACSFMPDTWSKFNDYLISFGGEEGGPCGMQDPSSQTRGWTCAPSSASTES